MSTKKIEKKELRRKLLRVSEGLLSTMTDFLLFQIFMLGALPGKGKTSRGAYQAIRQTYDTLDDINYGTVKNAISHLKRKGLVRIFKEPEITCAGKKRLKTLFPVYQSKRPWDGHVYLIAYDIPEKKRHIRNKLRGSLKKLGAGFLQASVWLTPYNLTKILQDFSKSDDFEGEIIVSCIGKDGYIGEESLNNLIKRVYNLDGLNYEYSAFIKEFKFSLKPADKWYAAVSYLSILENDPQLPWELLPNNWLGDKAYLLYKKVLSKNI